MSVRGIEIHNGQVVFPEGMPQEFHLGTEASPLTQGEAAQIVVSAFINAIALGGVVVAGFFAAIASVSLTGELRALRARATVNDGIVVTGSVYGAYIETEVLGAGEITGGYYEGLRIENYVEAGADISALQHYSIFIVNQISSQPATYSFIRMSENGPCTIASVFHIYKGAACIDVEYLFHLDGTPTAWISSGGALTGEAGSLKIRIGSDVRYIQLYTTMP